MTSIYFIILTILSMLVAGLFFYIYKRDRERFFLFFSLSWTAYAVALVILMVAFLLESSTALSLKKIFDMYAVMAILFAVYKDVRKTIPDYWVRFSIYLLVWFALSGYLELDEFSTSLPIMGFDIAMGFRICLLFLRCKRFTVPARWIKTILFFAFCIIKTYFVWMESDKVLMGGMYFVEILYTNLLSVCVLLFYSLSVKEKMKNTEDRIARIVENAHDAFFYISLHPTFAFEYVTAPIQTITGYSTQAFLNKPLLLREIVAKEDLETLNTMFFSEPETSFPAERAVRIIAKDGEKKWIEILGRPIFKEGKVEAVAGSIRDINDMMQANEKMTESKRMRELMLSYISHELKTPVTLVLGYAQALRDGTLSEKNEVGEAIDTISEKALLLEHLIQDLSQLSQLETNQFSFAYEYWDCLEFATSIYKSAIAELENSGERYSCNLDEHSLEGTSIIVDQLRIKQVVSNLLGNALKYTRPKNRISVGIFSDKTKENVIIKIADRGMGIRGEDLAHIFESFYKTPNVAGKSKGRGLGLAISKQIVEAHDGTIKAESRYGKGSVFTIILPIIED